MPVKYKLILADPPWDFTNKKTGGSMRSAANQKYVTTGIKALEQLDVNAIADDDCLLAMWWVGAMPQEAIDLVNSWGFRIVNMNGIVWNKLTQHDKPYFGMGFYTRAGSESIILAVKKKPTTLERLKNWISFKPASHSVRAVFHAEAQIQFEAKVRAHSEKPAQVHDMLIELAGDVPRLEMFARREVNGWDVFGNEVDGSIFINLKG
jgi:N6-adenosine-specific RNA methylase IME4